MQGDLFPPFAPVMFVLAALPPALLVGWLWSANAGYIAMLTMAGYFLMYEALHTASHVVDRPFLDRHHLADDRRERLFRSEAPFYEEPIGVLDRDAHFVLVRRESPEQPPNFFVLDLAKKKAAKS